VEESEPKWSKARIFKKRQESKNEKSTVVKQEKSESQARKIPSDRLFDIISNLYSDETDLVLSLDVQLHYSAISSFFPLLPVQHSSH